MTNILVVSVWDCSNGMLQSQHHSGHLETLNGPPYDGRMHPLCRSAIFAGKPFPGHLHMVYGCVQCTCVSMIFQLKSSGKNSMKKQIQSVASTCQLQLSSAATGRTDFGFAQEALPQSSSRARGSGLLIRLHDRHLELCSTAHGTSGRDAWTTDRSLPFERRNQ